MSDPVADALIRIKNGYLALKTEVNLPYSKFIKSVCEVLYKNGYLADIKEQLRDGQDQKQDVLIVGLKYDQKKPMMREVKRISKPGLRIYKSKNALPFVLNGMGIAIISTPKGVMTDKEARKTGLGGEVVAYVW